MQKEFNARSAGSFAGAPILTGCGTGKRNRRTRQTGVAK
jgi:hypothetical protein